MQQPQPDANKGAPNRPRKSRAQKAARVSKTQNPDRQEEWPAPPDSRGTKSILAIASTHLMLYETYDAATRATITDTTPTKYNEVYAAAILALPKSSLRRCHLRGRLVTGTVK